MRTEADLDRLHEETVRRFPGGMTVDQFKQAALESADEDDGGRVYFPHVQGIPGNPLVRYSIIYSMVMDGLLDSWNDGSGRPPMHQPVTNKKITAKGRAWLAAQVEKSLNSHVESG